MLSQVSIFAENKKGRLQNITSLLQKENINIWGSITNDSAEYGIIRMVVSNPEHAEKVLAEAGYLCRLTEVLGVELDDEVGALNRLLISLEESNINVDYLYLSFNRDSGKPVMVLHTDDVREVSICLTSKVYTVSISSTFRLKTGIKNSIMMEKLWRTWLLHFAYIEEKGEESMRKYGESGILLSVVCNRCGKKLAVKEGILREGAAHFDVAWDYFSEKDGEVHHFDLCEECYDGVTREFLIEADKEERTELL